LTQLLHKYLEKPIGRAEIIELASMAKQKLNSIYSVIAVNFDYFITKTTPVSKIPNLIDYRCTLEIYSNCSTKIIIGVSIPITSLCPCSKEISSSGAHNQRGIVTIKADISDTPKIWFNEIISVAEAASSCELYSVLKREDEKFVTEKAYNNPKFVEDLSREIAHGLDNLEIKNYNIKCKNFESIHNHNAYAIIKKGEICS
jgi:GTP cyclohydrolase I